jgi:hypothetical protein
MSTDYVTSADDLADALRLAAGALGVAAQELELLDATESDAWPIPDDVQKVCDEHAAMRATLIEVRAWLKDGRRASETDLLMLYHGKRESTSGTKVDPPRVPVLDEVLKEVSDAVEALRRLRALSGAVRDVLNDLPGEW